MTIKQIKQKWIQEINEKLEKFGATVKDTSIMKIYDASKERGMSVKLWLCGECTDGTERFFYMYITKKKSLVKYYGTIYANGRTDFEQDVKDYKYLGKVD